MRSSRPFAPIVAPYATRFRGPGMEQGPDALYAALLGTVAEVPARRVPFELDAPANEALVDGLPRLRAAVGAVARSGARPLALLGECTLAPAVGAGLFARHPELAVIWIDAHGDLNTPETTPSGFLGGMPLAVLLGWCRPDLLAAAGLARGLPETRVALVGARDLDELEAAALAGSDVTACETVGEAVAAIGHRPAWLHLDAGGAR